MWVCFDRLEFMLEECFDRAQGIFRPCSRFFPNVLGVCFVHDRGMFRPCSTPLDRARGMFWICAWPKFLSWLFFCGRALTCAPIWNTKLKVSTSLGRGLLYPYAFLPCVAIMVKKLFIKIAIGGGLWSWQFEMSICDRFCSSTGQRWH